jgi:protein-S-isoprenylcysteine O-methyltransferase Ste14
MEKFIRIIIACVVILIIMFVMFGVVPMLFGSNSGINDLGAIPAVVIFVGFMAIASSVWKWITKSKKFDDEEK